MIAQQDDMIARQSADEVRLARTRIRPAGSCQSVLGYEP